MIFFKKLFTAPLFDDEIKTQQAYLLHIILWALICVPIPFAIYTFTFVPENSNRALIQTIFGEVVNIFLLIILRRGHVRAVSIIQVSAIWFFFAATAFTENGVQGEAYLLGFGLTIAIAGILLGGSGALIFTFLSLSAGGWMVYLHIQGIINPGFDNPPLTTWVVSLVLFPVGAILQYLASRTTRNALDRARTSEEKYRLISQVSSDYIFASEVDKEGRTKLVRVTGAFESMTGYTFEEYIASGEWPAHVHPDDVAKDAHDMETLKNNKDLRSEIRTYTKNGEIRWERIFAHPIWDDKENRLIGIIGAVQDVTERKQAEEALRKSEAIYRQAIEVAGAVPYHQTYDENGNIHYDFMSDGIRQITGYGPEEFNDTLWGTLVQERHLLEDLAEYPLDEAIDRVRSGKNPIWKCEHCIKARDGKIRWVFEAAVDLRDEHGVAYGSVGLYQDITERKQSEDALRYERDLLQIFMDNIPDNVYFKDTDSRFIRINQAQARFLGINNPQDAIGKTDLDLQNSELAQEFMVEEKKIIESGQSILNRIEFNPTSDGKSRWLSATKVPVKDSAERIIGTIGISRDVTEQKESQEKLQRAFLQQAAILNNIPDMAWLKDKNSHYVAVNEQFAKAAGIKIEEIAGKTDFDIWQANFAEKYRKDDVEVMQTRQRKVAEEIQADSTGKEYWVETTKTPIQNSEGEVIGTTGIARDITGRKKAEEFEQSRRNMLEKVVQLGKRVTESSDLKSTIKKIWHGVHDDLGFDRPSIFLYNREHNRMDDTVGTDNNGQMVENYDIWFPIGKGVDGSTFAKVLERPDGYYFTNNYAKENNIPQDHEMYHVRDYTAVAAWAGDKPVAVICADHNITHRPISAEQLEALRLFAGYAGLAIENARLNSALQSELVQRKNFIVELEAKNSELERFAYTVSHDLKSPLVTIRGFLGYLEKDAHAGNFEKFQQDVHRIETAVEKMQNLLQDLLELSRIGRLMNAPVEISLNEIVKDALEIVHGQLEEKNVSVEYQNNNVIINCDQIRMTEVIQNLIDNAIKFMGNQPNPHIKIGTLNNDKKETVVYIKDNGVGIAPEFHDKIFGLFNKLNPDSDGTGVGLSLVKRIIEVHGGRIWVESQVGKGTTFYFTIPASSI